MLRLSILALAAMVGAGCAGACGDRIVSTAKAPDARRLAVLFQRDCGATTGFSTQISVLGAGKAPTGAGNVFIADDDHGAARAAPWGGPWAEAVWLSPSRLLVRYDAKARVFRRQSVVPGVQISFTPIIRP